MSENIQSISQGTYTIGSTSATNFIAGPGIKIDEPSAGTVRIGNDETVLWEGSAYLSANPSNINVNDYLYNYDKVQFYIISHKDIGDIYIDTHAGFSGQDNRQRYDLFCPSMHQGNSGTIRFNHCNFMANLNSKSFSITGAVRTSIEGTTITKDACGSILCKIIGINRKSNA